MKRTIPLLLLAPIPAHAHHAMDSATPSNLFEGLVSGLAHPIIGVDHLLFVLAVGIAAYYFGRRAGNVIAFIGGTLAGTLVHLQQAMLAYPDAWVAGSLILIGGLLLVGARVLSTALAPVVFALCGLVHGYAYGEAIVGAETTPLVAYLIGFSAIQCAIALGAFAAARHFDRDGSRVRVPRAAGAMLSLAGVAFLIAALA